MKSIRVPGIALLFVMLIQMFAFAAGDSIYFNESFDNINKWRTNSKTVTVERGKASLVNSGTGEVVYLQKDMPTIPQSYIFEFGMAVESYASAIGVNIWHGNYRIYFEIVAGGIRYKNAEQGITTVSHPIGNDFHVWQIVCKDLNASIYIDGEFCISYDLPTFSSDKIVQFWCKANQGQEAKVSVDYANFRPYSKSVASQIENGVLNPVDEESTLIITDTENSNYKNEIAAVCNLGIMKTNDGRFEPLRKVTRGELAGAVYNLMNVRSLPDGTYFKDVYPEYEYYKEINVLKELGIVNGVEEGLFLPEQEANFYQAIKLIGCISGYKLKAEQLGGGYAGYITWAKQNGLLRGIDVASDFTRAELASLIYNSFDVHPAKSNVFGSGFTFSESEQTLIESFFGLEKGKGVLTANSLTSLTEAKSEKDERISIDGTEYNKGVSISDDLLGQKVEYIAEKNDGLPNKIIFVFPSSKNSIRTVNDRDIATMSNVYRFEYFDVNGKKQKISINENADFIYNGIADDMFKPTDYNMTDGYVELIDNNDDGVCEVIKVYSYTAFAVKSINKRDFSIDDLDGNRYLFDEDSITAEYEKDGDVSGFSAIRPKDVLSVFYSKGKKNALIKISRESDTAVVDSINQSKRKIVAERVEYELCGGFSEELKVGGKYKFYLDYRGRIACIDINIAGNENYAYLMAVGEPKNELSDEVRVKLLLESGKLKIFELNKKVKIYSKTLPNGSQTVKAATLLSNSLLRNTENKTVKQLVKYKLGNSGKITELYFAEDKTDQEYIYDNKDFSLNFTGTRVNYRTTPKMFGSKYLVNPNTVVFVVPKTNNTQADEDDYYVSTISIFINDGKYDISLYDCNKTKNASVVVVESNDVLSYKDGFVYKETITELDEDGNAVEKMVGYYNGNTESYALNEALKDNSYNFGDVLRVATVKRKSCIEAVKAEKILSVSNVFGEGFVKAILGSSRDGKLIAILGNVVTREDDSFTVTEDGMYYYPHTSGSASYCLVDLKNEKLSNSSINELKVSSEINAFDGSRVLLMKNHDVLKCVVIYI